MDCSNNKHDCTEIISKVFLALDGELSKEEEKDFLEQINRCSWCLEHFHIEKAFKEFLSKKLQRKEVKPALIKQIKSKIKQIAVE